MKLKIYFHDDGMPNQKNVKLELIDEETEVAHARFNIGVFYDGEPKKVEFSGDMGSCVVHVKLIDKDSYQLVDKIAEGLTIQVQKLQGD